MGSDSHKMSAARQLPLTQEVTSAMQPMQRQRRWIGLWSWGQQAKTYSTTISMGFLKLSRTALRPALMATMASLPTRGSAAMWNCGHRLWHDFGLDAIIHGVSRNSQSMGSGSMARDQEGFARHATEA